MKFTRRLVSAFVAAAAALTAAVSLSVTAGAESILSAKNTIDSGKSFSLKLNSTSLEYDYKLKLSKSGDIKVAYKGPVNCISLYLVDSDGGNINASKAKTEAKSGSFNFNSSDISFWWNYDTELASGTIVYSGLDKGTYYFRIATSGYTSYSGTGKTTFTVTYPQGGSSDSYSKVTSIQIPLKKGGSMQLEAVGAKNAEWKSSDKSVVSVSSTGKITANKAGTAKITASSGSSSYTVTIKVS